MAGTARRQRGSAWLSVLLVLMLSACSESAATTPVASAKAATPRSPAPATKPTPHPVAFTWQPDAPRSFVPQGLARAGDRLVITGYRWAASPADQYCHVIVIDTTTAAEIAQVTELRDPSVPGSPVCHHGGGAAFSRAGLWIAGSGRLWLVDPDHPGRVRRSWVVGPAIRASALAISRGRMWIAKYDSHGRGRLGSVDLRDLLAPGVTAVAVAGGPGVARAVVRPAPDFVQGIALDHRGLFLTRSSSRCGDLVRPRGAHRRLIPGAEGLLLVGGHHAWVISESGSHHYQSLGGRPDVPMLSFVDLDQLTEGRCFRA